LKKNAELNAATTNIIPLMFAATPEDAEMEFQYSDSGYCNGGRFEGMSKWLHGHAFKLGVQGKEFAIVPERDVSTTGSQNPVHKNRYRGIRIRCPSVLSPV